MDPYEISTCERMVMKIIWESEEDPDLAHVMNGVNQEFGKNWSHRQFPHSLHVL